MTFRRGENQWTGSDERKLNIGIEIMIEQRRHGSRIALLNGMQKADTAAVQE